MRTMKIKAYELISDNDPKSFSEKISNLMIKGYELYGNLFSEKFSGTGQILNSTLFTQAMVKYEEESKTEVKERKVVDTKSVIYCGRNRLELEEEIRNIKNKGWVIISEEKETFGGWEVKMVKYED